MTNPTGISLLRQRMIEDMTARGLTLQTQRGHILGCRRFAVYLKRSPETAAAEDVRLFQLHLMENGLSIQNRNRTMTGVRFLLRVTMRRHDLAAEIFHIKEPTKIPQILSPDEAKRLLMMSAKLQVRLLFSIGYGAGLRVSEVVRTEWVVYSKKPFGGPEAVLAYLSRYTHRLAISNRRLISADANTVSFKYKDYRLDGPDRFKVMTLATAEFIRRFLIHVLPKGFHRIRHYGLLANGNRAENIAKARELLAVPAPDNEPEPEPPAPDEPQIHARPCPCCGGRMFVIEVFARGCEPLWRSRAAHRPTPVVIRIDTS